MTHPSFKLIDIIHEHRIKDFLTEITKDNLLAVSILDPQGSLIIKMASDGISPDQIQQTITSANGGGFVQQLLTKGAHGEIQKAPDLSLYGATLEHSGNTSCIITIWFPQEKDKALSVREFKLIWLHLKDLLFLGYELDNLSSEIVRNYEELALLYNLSVQLGAQSDLKKIGKIVTEQVRSLFPGTKMAIMLLDEEKEEIVSETVTDERGNPLNPIRLKSGKGITGQIMSTRIPTIVCNVRENSVFFPMGFPVTSMLCVPLSIGNKVLGTINVMDKANQAEFTTYDMNLVSSIAAEAAVSIENSRLFREVKDLYLSAVKSLVMAIDAKDPYTHSHSLRVSELSSTVAEDMDLKGHYTVEDIRLAALLHDVGKIGVPEHVLLKPGKLTQEEWETMKQHPLHSTQILQHFKPFRHIANWVCFEHERHDGKGYPHGLKGEAIPLPSRIIAAADAFDAITSDRYYRKGRSDEEAIKILQEHSGTQFDPTVVDAFVAAYKQGKLKTSLPQ